MLLTTLNRACLRVLSWLPLGTPFGLMTGRENFQQVPPFVTGLSVLGGLTLQTDGEVLQPQTTDSALGQRSRYRQVPARRNSKKHGISLLRTLKK